MTSPEDFDKVHQIQNNLWPKGLDSADCHCTAPFSLEEKSQYF